MLRLPEWIRAKRTGDIHAAKRALRDYGVATVCEEARCPNAGECFAKPTAAFLILGSKCTRNCGFCSVTSSAPDPPDPQEPGRVALAARRMGLKYVVITSVTRDDLPDGGAEHFAGTVSAVRQRVPEARVEVLTPDFMGNHTSLDTVMNARPNVFNHNIETVSRLYPAVRPKADYRRSLRIIEYVKKKSPRISAKSGLMLGLGERQDEVFDTLNDLRNAGCDIVTIGQYLRPSRSNLPVIEYVLPERFEALRLRALSMGFQYAASAPLVRSSMNAEEMYNSN